MATTVTRATANTLVRNALSMVSRVRFTTRLNRQSRAFKAPIAALTQKIAVLPDCFRNNSHITSALQLLLLGTGLLTFPTLASEPAKPQTWLVGPDRTLKTPSQAARVATHGDTIDIDAAVYHNDYAIWHQDNLTIRGVGGMARLTSNQLIPNGKGIWVINGHNTLIENLAFSGATVRATNGAGIRHQGGDLTLRNTVFHHNEFSVLTGPNARANIRVIDSKFWHQQRANRYSHGIYIGTVGSFTITGSHFKGTDQGHQIKSRALVNRILYNRIEDLELGNSSRLIDLPNCGFSIVMGNDLHQGKQTSNTDVIGYGAEKCTDRSDRQRTLYVINNTLINEANAAMLARNHDGIDTVVLNNLIYGRGDFVAGNGKATNNLRLSLGQRTEKSWLPPADSAAIDTASMLLGRGESLVPTHQFRPPVGRKERPIEGPLDIGSVERAPSDR